MSCISLYTLANEGDLCILTSDITDKKYYNNPEGSNYYYPCSNSIPNCLKCDNKDQCIDCGSPNFEIGEDDKCVSKSDIDEYLYYKNSDNKYASCSKISNCEKCTSAEECISCIGEYKLIEGDDNKITYQNIDITNYYKIEGSKTYYRKCEKDIDNCEQCSSSTHCIKCKNNFAIIEDIYNICEDLSSQKYYYDDESGKYKLCSTKMINCEKCITKNDNFICKQCIENFAVKYDITTQCDEISLLENNSNFYSNDSGISYYSCSLYSDVKNCLECSNKEICEKCQSIEYELVNNGRLCLLTTDKEANLYYFDTELNLYTPCSELISDCNKCYNDSTCFECGNNFALLENDTCLSETIIEEKKNFYKDEITNKYVSCSIMDNCLTCSSSKVCLSCKEGFRINTNNQCEKNIEENDNKLSTGGIIGIVFGCVGFLLMAIGGAFFLVKKFANKAFKKEINTFENNDENLKVEKKEQNGQNEAVIHNTKRTIHNKVVT